MVRYLARLSAVLAVSSIAVFAIGLFVYERRTQVCGKWLGLHIATAGIWLAAAAGAVLAVQAYNRKSKARAAGALALFLWSGFIWVAIGSIASVCSGI